jgi:kynurenine formamidase
MTGARPPSQDEVAAYLEDRNWDRWGPSDQRGALNLISPSKVVAAMRTVQEGRTISLARPIDHRPAFRNPDPPEYALAVAPWRTSDGGYAHDHLAMGFHNAATTHIDALCHIWDGDGMWGGRQAKDVLGKDGAVWGGIEQWSSGIVTRGVLLDVPAHRGVSHVSVEDPVHGWELEAIAAAEGITLEPGDAVAVYSGREAWEESWENIPDEYPPVPRPGLHASCLPFVRKNDVAALLWDMMDLTPSGYDLPWTVHGALMSYGTALVDNALLAPLAQACAELGRWEFLLLVAPLRLLGGTGSPVNPLAIL